MRPDLKIKRKEFEEKCKHRITVQNYDSACEKYEFLAYNDLTAIHNFDVY